MGVLASKVIAVEREWKDYQEKKSLGTKEQMTEKHWNPGSANLTIFWILFNETFGWTCQGQAWCFGFQDVCLILAYGLATAKKMWGGSVYVNCQEFVTKHAGDKHLSDTPKVGAWVFFHNGTKWSHIGMVTGVYDKYITSVEGNTSGDYDKVIADGGAVVEKKHYYSTTKMKYWHFDYDEDEGTETTSEPYAISVGEAGLTVAVDLNVRDRAKYGKIVTTYKKGEKVYPTEKVFVNNKTASEVWYKTDKGWISAKHLRGWVYEKPVGKWWYLLNGYKCDYCKEFCINGRWFYANATGYIVQSEWVDVNGEWKYYDKDGCRVRNCYVKSKSSEVYYWLNGNGVWEEKWNTSEPNTKKYKVVC